MEVATKGFCKMLEHVRVAVRCRDYAFKDADVARGLNRCADEHSRVAAQLLNQICGDVAGPILTTAPPATSPRPNLRI
jgi:hypothetical protein